MVYPQAPGLNWRTFDQKPRAWWAHAVVTYRGANHILDRSLLAQTAQTEDAMTKKVYDEPLKVFGEAGEIILDGPEGFVVSLMPEAARLSGGLLQQIADDLERPQSRYGTRQN